MDKIVASNGSMYCNIRGVAEGTSYNIIYESVDGEDYQSQE